MNVIYIGHYTLETNDLTRELIPLNEDIEIEMIPQKYLKTNYKLLTYLAIAHVGNNLFNGAYTVNGNTISFVSYTGAQLAILLQDIFEDDYFDYNDICGKITFSSQACYDNFVLNRYIYPNDNTIMLYLLNSSKNKVTKDLIPVGYMVGNFPRAITKRNIMLDVSYIENYGDFNYVYINQLKRYYYVKDISFIKDFSTLSLIEDVLMSFDSLIRKQSAFIERNENPYDADKVDELVTYDYDKAVSTQSITPLINLFAKTGNTDYSYLISFVAKVGA